MKIEQVISILRKKYGVVGLSDGNCGMFSLAVCKILKENGIGCKLGFTYKECDPPCETINDVLETQTDIHHVFIQIGENYYDGSGKIDDNYLADFSAREYGIDHTKVGLFTDINIADKNIISLIENDTNWNITANDFYRFFHGKTTIKENIISFKDFYSHLITEGQSASDIEYEYDDYLQENPETNPIEDIKAVLDNMKVAYKEVEIPFSNNSYILTDQSIIEFDPKAQNYPLTFHKKDRFLYDSDFSEIESNVEETFNKDFWDSPSPLYHATQDDNVESIKENGLNTTTGTGINNRGASGAFTVSNIDLLYGGSYGNNIFKIDTSAMKRDGITPYVSMEPDVLDGAVRGQIAHIIGDNRYSPDSSDGQWEETVIINGKIDPKYLTLLQK